MLGLFRPPQWDSVALTWWLIAMLMLVYTAFSMLQISYQAYGAEITDQPDERTRVTSIREALGLVGVFLAAALPEVLSKSHGPRDGYAWFAYVFAPLLVAMVAVSIRFSPPTVARTRAATGNAFRAMAKPLKNALFNRLLIIFIFNGIAASIPATLVLFFIEDVVRRPDLSAHFLIAYFAAGALGMPLWVWLSRRLGKRRAWLGGMLLSIAAFVWAFGLGAGDATAFGLVCVMSGVALGADLALPPSILADVIDEDGGAAAAPGVAGRGEGAYFGLWNLVTKLNLALAAGISLPLLGALGYVPGAAGGAAALSFAYCIIPCGLKLLAVAALWAAPFEHPYRPGV
jgi:Na+/melibiose symporter-like transporter